MLMMPAKSVIGEFSISVAVLNSGIVPTVPPEVVTVEEVAGLILCVPDTAGVVGVTAVLVIPLPSALTNAEAGSHLAYQRPLPSTHTARWPIAPSAALPRQSTEP